MFFFPFYKAIPTICIITAFLLNGCLEDPPVYSKPPAKTFQLPLKKVKIEKIPIYYTTTGSVVSDARVDVSSRITGFIKDIAVHEGDIVAANQLLVALDEADVEGAIKQMEAAAGKAEAAFRDAETDVKRYEALFEGGSAPENALRKVRLQRDIAIDSLNEAKAALQTAIWQRNYTRIVSPVDGIVVARQKRNGDLATPGVPILTVESSQALLFETYVPETCVAKLQTGDEVILDIDALEKSFKGTIARIVPSGDPVTRSYLVKISMPLNERILPGMFGRARYCTGYKETPVISKSAVFVRGGLEGVFVLDKNKKARFRWLRFAKRWDECLEVSAGLNGGEIIIATNQSDLREGDIVTGQIQ